jgi:hypothetical protein
MSTGIVRSQSQHCWPHAVPHCHRFRSLPWRRAQRSEREESRMVGTDLGLMDHSDVIGTVSDRECDWRALSCLDHTDK